MNDLKSAGLINSRAAVSILFFVNGFLIGNWAPKIPEFAMRLGLSEAHVGLMIAVFGFGSLIAMPLMGISIAKFGTEIGAKLTSLVAATTLLWITLAPNVFLAAFTVFIFGAFIASMDVVMNAVAVDVERQRKTPIMSSCHGFWSLGGLVGAVSGGYLIQNFGIIGQAIVASIICLLLVAMCWGQLITHKQTQSSERLPIEFPRSLLPYLVGIVALFSAMPEGAVIDWSALYMRQELGSNALSSSFAFGAFSAAMAIVRFAGDPIRMRLGAVKTARYCALIAALGFLVSGLSTSPIWVICGFAITGLGLANLIPIAFSAAGNLPGLAPGIGLSITTTLGYSGILIAPAVLGYVAKYSGFAYLFAGLSIFLIAVFLLSSRLGYADFNTDE